MGPGTRFFKPGGTAGSKGGIPTPVAVGQDRSGQSAEGGRGDDGQDNATSQDEKDAGGRFRPGRVKLENLGSDPGDNAEGDDRNGEEPGTLFGGDTAPAADRSSSGDSDEEHDGDEESDYSHRQPS